jgi:cob(I)alamin adenosyltransferase
MTTADEHKKAMQALQAEQKKKVKASEHSERGLVLVHTGDGKGKSSSAFGVAARALGWGHQVAVVQFIKGTWKTGEREFFKRFPEELHWHTMGEGFTWNTQDRDQDIAAATAAFEKAKQLMESGDYDLVVLDEINIALRYDYLDVDQVISALQVRSDRTSVILTGRDAKPALMEMADLVSEMKEIKHPFQSGIKAKQGVDF